MMCQGGTNATIPQIPGAPPMPGVTGSTTNIPAPQGANGTPVGYGLKALQGFSPGMAKEQEQQKPAQGGGASITPINSQQYQMDPMTSSILLKLLGKA